MSARPSQMPTQNEPQHLPTAENGLSSALEVFLSQRVHLFRIAYRITGDILAAEDVVQEAWLRWQRTDRSGINNATAFLTTTTTRLAINVIQSAWCRYEAPTESFAEPIDQDQDPALRAELAAVVDDVLALLMERLTPNELAAYLLRKGFDYAYDDVARLIRTTVPNARQLVSRAQVHLHTARRQSVPPEMHRLLSAAFTTAARSGNLQTLEHLLISDWPPAVMVSPAVVPNSADHARAA